MKKINIETIVNQSIEKVWKAYAEPEHIVNWNFASSDWHCPKAENNMEIGGEYWARMEAKDGSFGFDFKAIYTEITPYKSFAYKMEDDRKVAVFFHEKENATQIKIAFDAENQNPLEMQQAGWQAILDNFKQYAESI